jgi:hypothetical protein
MPLGVSASEPGKATPPPLAVVMDTSAFGRGDFDINKVKGLARRLKLRGVELWIPMQVIYECAAHARSALDDLRKARERLSGTGLIDDPGLPSASAANIAATFNALCDATDNVEVLAMDGESAIEAIKDQILGTGPGRIQDGVRTGASDSSWIRDTLIRADWNLRQIVFLSGDLKDIRATVVELELEKELVRTASGERDLFDRLLPPNNPLDPTYALKLVTDSLFGEIRGALAADDGHGPPPRWIEVSDVQVGRVTDYDQGQIDGYYGDVYVELEPSTTLVEVRDVLVDSFDDGVATASYSVILLSDVRVEGFVIDNDGNSVNDYVYLQDRLITVPYVVEICNGVLGEPRQTDSAESEDAQCRFNESDEAYHWLYDEVIRGWSYVSIEIPTGEDRDLPLNFWLLGPSNRSEKVMVVGSLLEDWSVEFENSGVRVRAVRDETVRVKMSRDEWFDMSPPIYLVSEVGPAGRALPEPFAALGRVWEYLFFAYDK